MTEKKVEFAPQEHIELYEETARRFMREVLDMDLDECLITDESYLSDFSSCGMSDDVADGTKSLQELYAAWDTWVLSELKGRYGLEYTTTAVPLLTLFRDLEETWAPGPFVRVGVTSARDQSGLHSRAPTRRRATEGSAITQALTYTASSGLQI